MPCLLSEHLWKLGKWWCSVKSRSSGELAHLAQEGWQRRAPGAPAWLLARDGVLLGLQIAWLGGKAET